MRTGERLGHAPGRVAVALAAGLMLAPSPGSADLEDVRACVEANTPRISTVQEISLSVEEGGRERLRTRFTLYWRSFSDGERRILLRFAEPADLSKAAVLIHTRPGARPRVHLYLPGQDKPQRVSSRGDLEGFLGRANLGIEEIKLLLDPLGGGNLQLIRESADLDGRKVWVLEKREAPGNEDRFPRTLAFIDHELCIPLRAELYDREDTLRKSLEVDPDRVVRVARSWVPQLLVFRDVRLGADTVLRVEKAEVDLPISPSLLSLKALKALSASHP